MLRRSVFGGLLLRDIAQSTTQLEQIEGPVLCEERRDLGYIYITDLFVQWFKGGLFTFLFVLALEGVYGQNCSEDLPSRVNWKIPRIVCI